MRRWGKQTRWATVAGALLLAATATAPVEAEGPRVVPVPEVEAVPADAGVRGGPYGFAHADPASFGYVEEEFFISGTAKSYGTERMPDAEYKTRLYVLRPADPTHFNGTVITEWLNVSGGVDAAAAWSVAHEHLVRDGFVFVGVTAQRVGQEGTVAPLTPIGPGPMALRQFDPVRYGSLHHPGDDYAFDIFSQAGMAILAGTPSPITDYQVERLIATGQSQSGRMLGTYLRHVHAEALRSARPGNAPIHDRARQHPHERRVYDGVLPMTATVGEGIPTDTGPIVWVNEVREDGSAQPDGGQFRLIEIAGAPHFSWWGLSAAQAANARSQQRDLPSLFVRDDAAQYGERGSGPCPRGFFPDRFAYHAAIDHIDRWLRTGEAPKSWPRIERDAEGEVLLDEHGNPRGGFRLPVVDVPVATYETCALFGSAQTFDPLTLAELYPTHDDYVVKMAAAIEEAVADGRMLPIDGKELLAQADASDIGRGLALLGLLDPGTVVEGG